MNSQCELLLDLGGSNTKLQLWVEGLRRETLTVAATPPIRGKRGEVTIDPAKFLIELRKLIEKLPADIPNVTKVAVTGQMASFLFVDRKGNPVSPIISWQDERSLSSDSLHKTVYLRTVQSLAEFGYVPWDGVRAGLPLIYLSILAEEGGIPPDSRLLSITQFAASSLYPNIDPWAIPIHESEAAATGLFDTIAGGWDLELASHLGIPIAVLPLVETTYKALNTAGNDAPEVMIPVGDFQAAVHGVGLREDEAFIHIATGGQIAVLGSKQDVSTATKWTSEGIQIRPSLEKGQLLLARTHLPAGRLLASAERMLRRKESDDAWHLVDSLVGKECPVDFRFHDASFQLSGLPVSGVSMETIACSIVNGVHDTFVKFAGQLIHQGTVGATYSGGALAKLPRFVERFEEQLQLHGSRNVKLEDSSLLGIARLNHLYH